MASLLRLTHRNGRYSDSRERDPAEGLRGRLDPLTIATYRWRLISGAYDTDMVIDLLAKRLEVEVSEA